MIGQLNAANYPLLWFVCGCVCVRKREKGGATDSRDRQKLVKATCFSYPNLSPYFDIHAYIFQLA